MCKYFNTKIVLVLDEYPAYYFNHNYYKAMNIALIAEKNLLFFLQHSLYFTVIYMGLKTFCYSVLITLTTNITLHYLMLPYAVL